MWVRETLRSGGQPPTSKFDTAIYDIKRLILKYGTRGGDLRQTLVDLGRAAAALGLDELVTLIRYLVGEPNEVDAALVRDVLKEILPGQEERIISIAAEEWKAEGIQIGLMKGKAEGRTEAMAATLLKQLSRRFGRLPVDIEQRIRSASVDELDAWLDAVIDAGSLEEVFR